MPSKGLDCSQKGIESFVLSSMQDKAVLGVF